MSAALPSAFRARFREYIEDGLSGRAAALRLKVSAATAVRWQRRLRETGSVRPEVQGRPAGHGKLAAHRAFPEALVAQDGDITLPELAGAPEAATGVAAHAASIGRFLRKPGYTCKRSRLLSAACLACACRSKGSRPNVSALAQSICGTIGSSGSGTASLRCVHILTGLCSFPLIAASGDCRAVDETSLKTNLTRLRGRSLRGHRLEMSAPFGAWGTQTFVAGLTHDSLISPRVIKGAPLVHERRGFCGTCQGGSCAGTEPRNGCHP